MATRGNTAFDSMRARSDLAMGRAAVTVVDGRERVERLWSRLKEWRAVATRYDKTARSFLGVLSLAATFVWIRR